jgi:outer membrane protein assembly factor BamB
MAWQRLLNLLLSAACFHGSVVAGDWPQFRGPNNSGVSPHSRAPSQWSDTKNLAWNRKIPGYGWSSPIIVGDKLIVTTAVTENQKPPQPFSLGNFGLSRPPDTVYRWELHCLDRHTGKTLWSQVALKRKPRMAATPGNTYASETPVSDGRCVYAYFGMHGVYSYTLDGKELWHRDLGVYKMLMNWGTGSSPALDGDRLFILCDNDEKSFLVALDKKTGKDLWRVTRDERSNWTTPFVWRNRARTEIVTAGGNAIRAYDPADGKMLWQLRRGAASISYVNATPVASESMLYVAAGSKPGSSPLWAVKAGASGDITPKRGEQSGAGVAWGSTRACPEMASPLLYADSLYILMQNSAMLMCLDARTGREVYKERIRGARSFTSSPWAHDGKLYCLDEDGQTFVVEAGPRFKLLGKNEIKDMFWATPALSRDALYLRGADRLYCVRQ